MLPSKVLVGSMRKRMTTGGYRARAAIPQDVERTGNARAQKIATRSPVQGDEHLSVTSQSKIHETRAIFINFPFCLGFFGGVDNLFGRL